MPGPDQRWLVRKRESNAMCKLLIYLYFTIGIEKNTNNSTNNVAACPIRLFVELGL